MAYIPAAHAGYNLLPYRTANGGEVFAYSSTIQLETLLREYNPSQPTPDPYGYPSFADYIGMLDGLIAAYSPWPDAVKALERFRAELEDLNQKEKWSVCRYVGKDHGGSTGLTCGRTYYWPCSASHPEFIGVIDDEEYTNYPYPPNPKFWLIAEDPTGMAARTMLRYQETRKEKRTAAITDKPNK